MSRLGPLGEDSLSVMGRTSTPKDSAARRASLEGMGRVEKNKKESTIYEAGKVRESSRNVFQRNGVQPNLSASRDDERYTRAL